MQCPYCQSSIPDSALSCSFCTKDLYLFKPLLQKIASLEEFSVPKQALAELEQKVARLEQLLEQGLHSPALAEQPAELPAVATGTAIGLAYATHAGTLSIVAACAAAGDA